MKNIALTLSALVTLFTTWDAFFNHKALWINQTNSANQLKAIKSELEYLSSEGSDNLKAAEIDRLYAKYQSVLDSTNLQWMKLRDDDDANKSESPTLRNT